MNTPSLQSEPVAIDREQLQKTLESTIVLIEADGDFPEIDNIRARVRLFYAVRQPSNKYLLAIIGKVNEKKYAIPSDELIKAVYDAVTPQLEAHGTTWGSLLDKVEYAPILDENNKEIGFEDRVVHTKTWITTAIIGRDLINGRS